MIKKHLLFLPTSVAMAMMLVGCDDKDENKEFGEQKDCQSYMGGTCTEVRNPVKITEKNAPRFRTIQECEAKFGGGNCLAPRSGRVSAVFSTMDACENVYGENTCTFRTLPVAEDDEDGNIRTEGYVWTGRVSTDHPLTTEKVGLVDQAQTQPASQPASKSVYHPVVTPYAYWYPYTYGYWGGSPYYTNPPPRVGGSYYTSSRAAALSPGTSGTFRGTLTGMNNSLSSRASVATGGVGGSKSGSSTSSTSSSSGGSRSGTVSSTGGSRAGGVGSTGSGGTS